MGYRLIAATVAAAVSVAASAGAAPMLAGYPAPGGTSYSASGFAFGTGGATWTYSGFDIAAWDQLWWGLEDIELAMDGAIDSPGEFLSLSSMSGATATWMGLTSILAGPVETRVTATIVSGGSDWMDPTSLGIATGIEAVSEVTGTVPFVVDVIFEARFVGGSAWTAWYPFFDPNTGASEDGNSRTSYYRNFYYTEPVPVPASVLFGLSGLGLLAGMRRFKRT